MSANKNPWLFFLKNWRFTWVVILATFIVGFVSVVVMPKESDPDIEIPIVTVSTVFPGASADEVEDLVTDVLEDKLIGLEEVDEVNSVSRRGLSMITVSFDVDSDPDESLDKVRERVDLAMIDLPSDADDPLVQKVSFSDVPILTVALSGPYSIPELDIYAQEVADALERLSGVSTVQVVGGQDREVTVSVDKASLDKFGLSLAQVTDAIRRANSNVPVGNIETSGENFNLRLEGGIFSAQEVADLSIIAIGGSPVFVRDVAEVRDTYVDPVSFSRLSIDAQPTEFSVSLKAFKVSGGNVIATVDTIWETIEGLQSGSLPEDLVFVAVEDNAKEIREDLSDLLINGSQTVLIVILLLIFFLGWREALLSGIGIPLTFLMTFAFLQPLGYTLNFLTLFSLILSLGIIVDGTIVMTEGIHQEIKLGRHPREAAARAIRQYYLPLTAGTFTTIFAFLPMMLTSGIIGKFIESIPVTVTIVLLSSLFIALAIIPAVASRVLKKKENELVSDQASRRSLRNVAGKRYQSVLSYFLHSKKRQRVLALGLVGAFFASLALPVVGILQVNMFPQDNEDTVYIDIENSFGTPLELTDASSEVVEEYLIAEPDVESFLINVGSASDSGSALEPGSVSDSHLAHVIVNLNPDRKEKSTDIVKRYGEELQQLSESDIQARQLSSGPGDAAPVEVRVSGPELSVVNELAYDVERYLQSLDTTANIGSSIQETNGEFVLTVNRAKASLYGVTTSDIALVLRNAVYGTDATTIKGAEEDIDVVVKYDLDPLSEDARSDEVSLSTIEGITVATPSGEVPLNSIVDFSFEGSQAAIDHLDGDRIVYVTSQTEQGVEAATVFGQLDQEISTWTLPDGYSIEMGGEREDIQQSFTDMLKAMVLGLFLIAALLVWQFSSFRQPLFILVTVPLALIGVLPGLVIVNQPLSFPGLIGIVALTGIVVNNAIILIDKVNVNRRSGMDKLEAVSDAAQSRLQPILLTTVTTVAGLLPLALSSATWGPLGYSIIFGLLFSTVLTLLVVPVLYLRFGEKELETFSV